MKCFILKNLIVEVIIIKGEREKKVHDTKTIKQDNKS